ncbi:Nitrite reductase [NAD(P)H] [compost metagenome]
MFIGGNGGIKPRIADSFCKVKTDEELIEVCSAVMQFYRETGNYLERTSEWVERMGLENIQRVIMDNAENRKELAARIDFALAQVSDPWKKMLDDDNTRSALFEKAKL